jgi:serine/threonine protein kinase/WD40 repeat protein
MTELATCPDRIELKDLLDGTLPDDRQAELQDHLESCFVCQAALEGLAAGKETWCGAAEKLDRCEETPEEGLRRVLEECKHHGPGEDTSETPAANDVGLDFLGPRRDPAHLGRIGHYDVLEVIGRGGMGVVLKAFDSVLHRVVAIKVLAPQLATTTAARKRFEREGRAAAAISHEHVVAIHAVEETPTGLPYLVMEYVPGVSLQEKVDCAGPLELKEILRIGMQTARGLAAAHAQGLVHRDIKPANILLYNGVERVKITDFGLARAVDDASVTQSGFVAGTPQYMAPEQARGEAVDHRADLFSLGSVLYALCTGRPPFRASTTLAVLKRVAEERARPIREINWEIPAWLATIIDRLHAKQPGDRYASAAEVAELLEQRLAEVQTAPSASPPAHTQPPPAGPSRVRWWAIGAALLFCGSLVVGQVIIRIKDKDGKVTTEVRVPDGHTIEIVPAPAGQSQGPNRIRRDEFLRPGSGVVISDDEVIKLEGGTLDKAAEAQFRRLDRNGDGLLNLDEMPATLRNERDKWDANKDGFIDLKEYQAYLRHRIQEQRAIPAAPTPGQTAAVLVGPRSPVRALVFTPDGTTLVSVGGEVPGGTGELHLWDVRSGKERAYGEQKLPLMSVACSPGGTTLATGGGDETVRMWSADTGKLETVFRGHAGPVNCVAFAPDGQTLASGSSDHTVKIWRLGTRELLENLEWKAGPVRCLAFAPDGKTLAVGGGDGGPPTNGEVRLIDEGSWRTRTILSGQGGRVRSLAFSPDGGLLVAAYEPGQVAMWDRATGRIVRMFRPLQRRGAWLGGQPDAVFALAFSPDGRFLATTGEDATVKLYDVASGKEITSLAGHSRWVTALAFSPDGKTLASAGQDQTVRLWNVAASIRPAGDARGDTTVDPLGSKSALEQLQGDWVLIGAERDGKPAFGKLEQDPILMVRGNRMKLDGPVLLDGIFQLHGRRSRVINLTTHGEIRQGIYELSGNRLLICLNLGPALKLPDDFTTKPGSRREVWVFRRVLGLKVQRPDPLQERLTALREIAAQKEKLYAAGTMTFEEVARSRLQAFKAELPLCTADAERIAVHERIVACMKELEKLVEQLTRAGVAPAADLLRARADRAEAEAELELARRAAEKKADH